MLTANSWNSVGSRASPSMICWNHDATDPACGCTSPQAKCFEVARGFVQDVPLNATFCAGPAPSFLGHLTSLLRHTGGGFPHSLTVRPRRSGGFGGVVAGASVMCVSARARGARSLAVSNCIWCGTLARNTFSFEKVLYFTPQDRTELVENMQVLYSWLRQESNATFE